MSKPSGIISILPAVVFVFVLVVFWKTAGSTLLSYGDAAELVTASYTLGIPHAPGYPLYMMIGKLFSLISWGDVAHRYSVLTCLLGSTTILFVFLILRELLDNSIVASVAAFSLAFSYHFWLYSLVPEISSLHALLVVLLLYMLISWRKQGVVTYRRIYMVAFVFGLAMAHHHTVLLLVPGMVAYLFMVPKEKSWSFAKIGTALLFFALGLLPYLYLPLAKLAQPEINGLSSNKLAPMIDFILRKEYGSFRLAAEYTQYSWSVLLGSLRFYFQCLWQSFYLPGVVLALLGLVWFYKKRRFEFWLFLLSFVFLGPLFYALTRMAPQSISEKALLEKFLPASFLLVAIFLGGGFYVLVEWARNKIQTTEPGQKKQSAVILLIVSFILPAWMLSANVIQVDKSEFELSRNYAWDLFESFKPGAIVCLHGDNSLFSARYMQLVEGMRPDVSLFNSEEVNIREMIDANIGKRPIHVVGLPGQEFVQNGLQGNPYFLQPHGLGFEVVAQLENELDDSEVWKLFAYQGNPVVSEVYDLYAKEMLWLYALAHYNKAVTIVAQDQQEAAIAEAQHAIHIMPEFIAAQQFLRKWEQP
jgi:Protein O-mannosyl-transferase TMEM260-like